MGILANTLVHLASAHDGEMLDGYNRYEALLTTVLTLEQLEAYADYIQQSGEIRIFEEMAPAEIAALPPEVIAVATAVMADTNLTMENRRVVSLLHQRGEDEVVPDFDPTSESRING